MKTEQDNVITEDTLNFVESGTILKEKREELGLTQQQVADRLRLRVSIVQNLEANKFDSDLVATFIRGYLRSYAKAVGVKESVILEAYEKSSGTVPQEHRMKSFSKKTKRAKHDSRITIITWGILVILLGMSSLWWWQNHREAAFEPEQNAEVSAVLNNDSSSLQPNNGEGFATVNELTEESGEQPVEEVMPGDEEFATAEETVAVEQGAPDAAEDQPTNTQNNAVAEEPASVETTSTNITEPVVAETNDDSISMTFSSDCWIQVKDASGKTLSTGVKKAGQTLSLRGKKPYQVILGAPEGVSMTFANEPVDLSGYTSGKVARFTLP